MGASNEEFIQERENFFTRLDEDEEYAVLSVKIYMLDMIKDKGEDGKDYTLHNIKQSNPKQKDDKVLQELYKKKSKLSKEITKREQDINHNKK